MYSTVTYVYTNLNINANIVIKMYVYIYIIRIIRLRPWWYALGSGFAKLSEGLSLHCIPEAPGML